MRRLAISLLRRIKSICFCWLRGIRTDAFSTVMIHPSARVTIPRGTEIRYARIVVEENAELRLSRSSVIGGVLLVGKDCSFLAGEGFRLNRASIILKENSTAVFGNVCLVERSQHFDGALSVTGGMIQVGDSSAMRGVVRIDPAGKMKIGSHSFINHGSEIRCGENIQIGDFVYISYHVDIFDTNTHPTSASLRRMEQEQALPNTTITDFSSVETRSVSIEDDVWIGKRAAILKGCSIGERSIVGSHSVVTKSCPPDSLVVGSPALQIVRTR